MLDVFDQSLFSINSVDKLESARTEFFLQLPVAGEFTQRGSESLFVTTRNANTPSIAQQIDDAAYARRNYRARVRHCFNQRQRCSFIKRSQRDNIECGIKILRILPV